MPLYLSHLLSILKELFFYFALLLEDFRFLVDYVHRST